MRLPTNEEELTKFIAKLFTNGYHFNQINLANTNEISRDMSGKSVTSKEGLDVRVTFSKTSVERKE